MTTTEPTTDDEQTDDYCPPVADQDPEWVDDNLLGTRYEH